MKRSHKLCFGLLLALSIMFGSFLNASSNVNAASVDCGDIVSSLVQNDRVLTYTLSSCDTSSLNSSSTWFYSFTVSAPYSSWYSYLSVNPTRTCYANNNLCVSVFRANSSSLSDISTIVTDFVDYNGSHYHFPYFNITPIVTISSLTLSISDVFPSCSSPSGSLSITQNGTFDVSQYAEAVVNVENEVIYGDYHDDLVSINNSILIAAAVALVIYFFYAIYKMLLGGKR